MRLFTPCFSRLPKKKQIAIPRAVSRYNCVRKNAVIILYNRKEFTEIKEEVGDDAAMPSESPGPVTRLLQEWQDGNAEASERLVPLVYAELRRLAAGYIRAERSGHTLQPTALVHEAFLRLVDQRSIEWKSRAHFVAIAAQLIKLRVFA